MPYKRKDSAVWWISITGPDGRRVRRSAETEDRKEAEALEAKWKLTAYQVKNWGARPERSFEELMLCYLQAHTSKRSAHKDRQHAARLRAVFAGAMLNKLSAGDIRGYISSRKAQAVGPAIINRELSLLSAAINYANQELDWGLPNPVKGRKLKEPEGRSRWLNQQEARALIAAAAAHPAAQHLADFIRLALATGCRSGELLGLEWARVDLRANLLHLEGRHTKSGKRRSVPLSAEARESLLNRARFRAKHCPDCAWVFANAKGERIVSLKTSFATACKVTGLQGFRIHDLRHTCAAWLVSAGVPLAEVRDLLGHSTVTLTERYAHLAPENIRAAVARVEGWSRSGHGAGDFKQASGR